jgi:parallel beta-helix repeat protein
MAQRFPLRRRMARFFKHFSPEYAGLQARWAKIFPRFLPLSAWQSAPIVAGLVNYFKGNHKLLPAKAPARRNPLGYGVRRLAAEPLEERQMLSLSYVDNPSDYTINATTHYAGDWYVDVDQGTIGTLDMGDTVTWQKEAAGQVTGLNFGTSAFGTIQSAINAAAPSGDTINVAPGTYNESQIIINKGLTLQGAGIGNSIIDGGDMSLVNGGLLRVTASASVTFDGFTLQGAGADGDFNRFGIYTQSLTAGPVYTITHNKIIGTNADDAGDYGIYACGGKESLVFQYNTITQTGSNPILIEAHPGATNVSENTLDEGFYGSVVYFNMTYGGVDVTTPQIVHHNTINMGTGFHADSDYYSAGIVFRGSYSGSLGEGKFADVQITDNVIYNMQGYRRGISLSNDSSMVSGSGGEFAAPEITGNQITSTSTVETKGIQLLGLSTDADIGNNIVSGAGVGLLLATRNGHAPTNALITDHNRISGSTTGIQVDGAVNTVIDFPPVPLHNEIFNNVTGVLVTGGATGTVIMDNDIYSNVTGILFNGNAGGSVTGNQFAKNASVNGTDIRLDPTAGTVTLGTSALTANTFSANTCFIDNRSTRNIDATHETLHNLDPLRAAGYVIEDKMYHKMDDPAQALGLITWISGNLWVTSPQFLNPDGSTSDSNIQRAIDIAAAGSIIHIEAGEYTGDVDVNKAVTLSPGGSPGQVIINGNLALSGASTIAFEINGTNPASDYDNFIVNGAIDLGNAAFTLSKGYAPSAGDRIVLIDNNDADSIANNFTFNGLTVQDGDYIWLAGTPFQVNYGGGDGNDLVLTAFAVPTEVWVNDTWREVSDGDGLPGIGTGDTVAYDLTAGDLTDVGAKIYGVNAFASVHDGVAAVAAGGIVDVLAGTYAEQVTIQKSLTLLGIDGRDNTTILAPSSGRVTAPGYTGASVWNTDYILAAYATTGTIDVEVNGLTFEANGQSHIGDRFTGVFFRNVSGTAGLWNSAIGGFNAADPSATGVRAIGNSNLTIQYNVLEYTVQGIVAGGDADAGLDAGDPNVWIDSNTVNHGANTDNSAGIVVEDGAWGIVSDNFVDGGEIGIWALNTGIAGNVQISGNEVSNAMKGIEAYDADYTYIAGNDVSNSLLQGIWDWSSDHVTIESNNLDSNLTTAIDVDDSTDLTIDNNHVADFVLNGIELVNITGSSVYENEVSGNLTGGTGILIWTSSSINISDNIVHDTTSNGIYLYGSSDNTLYYNDIGNVTASGGGWGIGLDANSTGNAVGYYDAEEDVWYGNSIYDCDIGVWMGDGSTGNSVVGNEIYENGIGVQIQAPSWSPIAGSAALIGNFVNNNGAGVDVDGGIALLQDNDLNSNTIGLLIRNGGTVDAGQVDDVGPDGAIASDFTGLGMSTGGNDFSSYTDPADASSGAIVNLNADSVASRQGAPPDVMAEGNSFFSGTAAGIETVVYHDVDNPSMGFVDFADLSNLSFNLVSNVIDEGFSASIDGSFENVAQGHVVTISWGDLTSNTVLNVNQGVFVFNASHPYADDGIYTITVTVSESTTPGNSLANSQDITVNNVPPTANAGGPYTIAEGEDLTLAGSGSDPSPVDALALTYSWDLNADGVFGDATGAAPTLAWSELVVLGITDDGTYAISLKVSDEAASTISGGTLIVTNAPPAADAGGPYTIAEGEDLTLAGSGSDPSPVDALALTYSWDLNNDGVFGDTTGATPTVSWTELVALGINNDEIYPISLKVADEAASTTAAGTLIVTNTPPTADAGGPYAIIEGEDLALAGSGNDVSPADQAALTYAWDLDGDGAFDDASGASPTVTWSELVALGINDDGLYLVSLQVSDNMDSTIAEADLNVKNAPPTASIVGNFDVYYLISEGDGVNLVGTATDPSPVDQAALTYAWDLDSDGVYDNATGESPSLTWSELLTYGINNDGAYMINLQATDPQGDSGYAWGMILVSDTPPTADAGGPYTIAQGSDLLLAGLGYDISPVDNAALSYTWDLNNDGTYDDVIGSSPTVSWAQLVALGVGDTGLHTIWLQVTDDVYSVQASGALVIHGPPEISNISYNSPVDEGSSVTVTVTASGWSTLSYEFDFNNDGIYEVGPQADNFASHVFADSGAYAVGVRVSDLDGSGTTGSTVVTINNVPPTADAGGPYAIAEGDGLTLAGSGSDISPADNASLTFAWDLDGDGAYDDAFGAAPTLTWLELESFGINDNGNYTITLQVTDDADSTTSSSTVAVTNAPPTAAVVGDFDVYYLLPEGADLHLAGLGVDPSSVDQATLTYSWDMDNDGVYDDASGASPTVSWPQLLAFGINNDGLYPIGLHVADKDGGSATAAGYVLVMDSPPTADAGGPYSLVQSSTLQLAGSGSDPSPIDNASLSYTWDLNADGTYDDVIGASPMVSWSQLVVLGIHDAGNYTIWLQVTDDTYSVQVSGTLVIHALPAISNIANDGPADEGSPITVTVTATGETALRYEFDFNNDGLYEVGPQSSNLASHTYFDNDTYTVGVRVSDLNGYNAVGSTTVMVNNVPPSPMITGVPAGNTSPEETAINLGSIVNDPASDLDAPYTYLWHVTNDAGQVIPAGTSSTFSFTPDRPGNYTVELLVWDKDLGFGSVNTDTIVVEPVSFRVTNFMSNTSGFEVQFIRPANQGVLNLYDGMKTDGTVGNYGLSDVTVTGPSGAVRGSLLWNAGTNSATFVASGNALAAGTYNVTLWSRDNAWQDQRGGAYHYLLDGDANGIVTVGDNYTYSFVVGAPAGPVVSLPDFARGPDQDVKIPAIGAGLPIKISNAGGLTSISLVLDYKPVDLTITDASLAAGMSGWTITTKTIDSTGGHLTLAASGPALGAGARELFNLSAHVPVGAVYGASEILAFSSLQLNGGSLGAVADRALQKIAYLGDASGNRSYGGSDATMISRVSVYTDTGFFAFPLVDPWIIGNSSGAPGLGMLNASNVARKSVHDPLMTAIPDLPASNHPTLPPVIGLDPIVSIASGIVAAPGGVAKAPVNIEGPGGLQFFDLQFTYNTKLLDLSNADVKLAGLTSKGWSLAVNARDDLGVVYVTGYGATPLTQGVGSILEMDFHVPANVVSGTSVLTVAATPGGGLNDGLLPITPVNGSIKVAAPTSVKVQPKSILTIAHDLIMAQLAAQPQSNALPSGLLDTAYDQLAISVKKKACLTLEDVVYSTRHG